jgi:hypothetical protein
MNIARWRRLPGAALLTVAFPAFAHAQTGAASFTGLVTDEYRRRDSRCDGQDQPATGVAYEPPNEVATTRVKIYVVKAELAGFRTSASTPSRSSPAVARLDFKMLVGAVTETAGSSGAAPILQSETTTVGEVLRQHCRSLPLNAATPRS